MIKFFEELLDLVDAPEEFITVKGSFAFYLDPVIKGVVPYHTCSVIISCYENAKKQEFVDFDVRWYKIIGNDTYEYKDYTERYYHCNASDADVKIKAVVTSKDPRFPGVAYFSMGPMLLDPILKPEVEGMLLNSEAFFVVNVLEDDSEKLLPNLSSILIRKPFMGIHFDSHLARRDRHPGRFDDIELNVETDLSLKVRADPFAISTMTISSMQASPATTGEPKERELKIKFDSRMQRDIFYIYFKLMRMLRAKIIMEIKEEFEVIMTLPWIFLNQTKNSLTEDSQEFHNLFSFDLVREQLKSMVRLNKELNEENTALIDTMDILEADFDLATKEYQNLLEDSKKNVTKNLRKYEKSGLSILQESSMVIDDVRSKTKKKKKEIEANLVQEIRQTQEDIDSIKAANELFKKEIEKYKSMTSKLEVDSPPKLESIQISAIVVSSRHQKGDDFQAEMSKRTLLDNMRRYNHRLTKKIQEFKELNGLLNEERRQFEESFESSTYLTGLGMDKEVHKQYLLKIIAYFHTRNSDFAEQIRLKRAMENREIKTTVLLKLLDEPEEIQTFRSFAPQRSATSGLNSSQLTTGPTDEQLEAEQVERLQAEIKMRNEESLRLDTELKNISTRNSMFEREIRKAQDFVRLQREEGLDNKLFNLESQLKEVRDEIELLENLK